MRVCEIITEAHHLMRRVNPTQSQVQAMLKSVKRECARDGFPGVGSLRGVVTDKNLIVWNGWYALHVDMGYGWVRDHDPIYLIEFDEEGLHVHAPQAEAVRSNPHVRRAFGDDPPIIAE